MRAPFIAASVALCESFFLLTGAANSPTPTEHSAKTSATRGQSLDTIYYYQTVPGKLMGVWTYGHSVDLLARLRAHYGFTHVIASVDTSYGNAIVAGFAPTNIMIRIDNPTVTVDDYPSGYYYIDEPVEHDCSGHASGGRLFNPSELTTIRDYVHQKRPGSLFIISGYKRCSHNAIAAGIADGMMYSSYEDWSSLGIPLCGVNMGWGDNIESPWLPGSADQRDSWTSMRLTYGYKYFMTWVNGASDEYDQLFAHANYLGLVGIWRYDPGPDDTANIETYCQAALRNGWMTRVAYTPLPIELVSFTAKGIGPTTVFLQWVTLSEMNNYGFEVQRRSGLADTFSTVHNGFVLGAGTTLKANEYSFTDSSAPAGRLWYRLKQIDLNGAVWYGPEVEVNLLTSVRSEDGKVEFDLLQNYPNPFNPSTDIGYRVSGPGFVSLKVYDVLGREVATLVDEVKMPGRYEVRWDAGGQPSGIYFTRMTAGSVVQTRKLVLLK